MPATAIRCETFSVPGDRLPSSGEWNLYFERNARNLLDVPWQLGADVSPSEVEVIFASIQEFQLGESSEGRHLIRAAREYAACTGDHDYLVAIERFIREEQRHARDLGRFMSLAGIPKIRKSWPDRVFRRLRHLAGLELSVAVLVTAEIIAKVYYTALQKATGSRVLRRICDQIIHDEGPHVEFQCQRLAILRRGRRGLRLRATHALHRLLFAGAILVVWPKHKRVLRAGGLTFRRYWRESWREYRSAERIMDPLSSARG